MVHQVRAYLGHFGAAHDFQAGCGFAPSFEEACVVSRHFIPHSLCLLLILSEEATQTCQALVGVLQSGLLHFLLEQASHILAFTSVVPDVE